MFYFLILAILLIFLRSYYEVHNFKVKEYVIRTKKVSDVINIVFFSDLHNCKYGKKNIDIVNAIESLNCDAVLIGGDLICGKKKMKDHKSKKYFNNTVDFLKSIDKHCPIFYTYGNHETRVKNRKDINNLYYSYRKEIENFDIKYMNNSKCNIIKGNTKIDIFGIEIPEESYENDVLESQELDLLKKDNNYSIMLVHTPQFFEAYSKKDIDLVLCGHNHGGTIRIPFIGGIISRDFKIFPKYSYGEYEKNNTKMVVTGGLGDHTIHFRLFNTPEIVKITIVPSNE